MMVAFSALVAGMLFALRKVDYLFFRSSFHRFPCRFLYLFSE
ncbi:hypothetical protein ASZ90_016162 [hydrocarbon metagenome]|uniref:Uncharacterized protein n=1 Tax=hydrocarbon metagenome TaxID=938273 RepID=A0A0W8EZY4_9ZZZZ